MRIVPLNTHQRLGGAAQVADPLHQTYRSLGHASTLISGFGEPDPQQGFEVVSPSQRQRLMQVAAYRLTSQDGLFTQQRWNTLYRQHIEPADVVHVHNLHGYYLPPSLRERLLGKAKVWTLHDEWLMTGRCGFHLDCDGYTRGCAPCPRKHIYPSTRSACRNNHAHRSN